MYFRISRVAAASAAVLVLTSSSAFADKGCKNIQSRCAIEVGGRCDPVTGHWDVNKDGAGGTVQAHNDCIGRHLLKEKKK
jgi:hypothetical protein